MRELFKRYSQRGFTLVEVIASVGISTVVALVVAKVLETGQRDIKSIEARMAINNLHQEITTVMQEKASCTMTLRDVMVDPVPTNGISVSTIKKCNNTILEDIDGDNYSEINCASADLSDLYSSGVALEGNFVEIDSMTYKNDIAQGGPRLEVVYNVLGAGKRVSGRRQVKKEPIYITESYNPSNIYSCQADITNILNASVEQSCQGNNAYLDKTQAAWKCYHEVDLPECPAGSVLVAANASANDQNAASFDFWSLGDVFNGVTGTTNPDSKRANPSLLYTDNGLTNNKAITFRCQEITPARDCDDSDASTLDMTIIKDAGTDLITNYYEYECVHVPNCYDSVNGLKQGGKFYHLVYDNNANVVDSINHRSFKCVEKKCPGANQIAVTTDLGEKCVSCPAGSVIIKTNTGAGFECVNTSCVDNKTSGTSASDTENVQQYFTGRWNADGTPVCRDLITTDGACTSGGALKVETDGSIRYECCPVCDSSFNAEKAQVCFGQSFTTTNGCTICEGTKDRQSGCPDPILYCSGTPMGTSDCGQACYDGNKPEDQGNLSDWGEWSICHGDVGFTLKTTTSRSRTCDGAECGGDCDGEALTETMDCEIYNGNGGNALSFAGCSSLGGVVSYVDTQTKAACNTESGMNSYLNSKSPTCVPLCFLPPTNSSFAGRTDGHPDSYSSKACGLTETTTTAPVCPQGYTQLQDFAYASSNTCDCCTVLAGCSGGGNISCSNVTASGYAFESRSLSAMRVTGADVVLSNSGKGNSCNQQTTDSFYCYPTINLIGCYK